MNSVYDTYCVLSRRDFGRIEARTCYRQELCRGVISSSIPLAERNLFVASKQERFRDKTGKDHDAVKHIIRRMVAFIDHMHKKGVLHADLKPLNIMRMDGQWQAIDLDAVCEIGKDPVGSKSSSVYIPPEAIHVDTKKDIAAVKSEKHRADNGLDYDLLIAHVSFDIWSL